MLICPFATRPLLTGALLTSTLLTGALLASALLTGALLTGTLLAGALLTGALLTGTLLTGILGRIHGKLIWRLGPRLGSTLAERLLPLGQRLTACLRRSLQVIEGLHVALLTSGNGGIKLFTLLTRKGIQCLCVDFARILGACLIQCLLPGLISCLGPINRGLRLGQRGEQSLGIARTRKLLLHYWQVHVGERW
ncbi:MAG: pentapeptide repeat-containing protein [Chloroflexota bacterium]